MKRGSLFSFSVALTLAALCGSIAQPGACQTPQPGTLVLVAGTGQAGFSGDGGPATQAKLSLPIGLTVDAAGNVLFAEFGGNNRVRKVTPDGIITTVAGTGEGGFSGDGGLATKARLDLPKALAMDALGNLFIADFGNNRVRKVTPNGVITTVAGNGQQGYLGDGGPATRARLHGPVDLAVDTAGNLFIADYFNDRIRKVGPDRVITTVAGGGLPADRVGDGGLATQARLKLPHGVAVDRLGNLFIADTTNNRIRKVGADGVITTVAGSGVRGHSRDGTLATAAQLNAPYYLTVDSEGTLYYSDNRNNRVRKVGSDGIITTVAGNGVQGFSGEGGPAKQARLTGPGGVAIDALGNLYFTDGVHISAEGSSFEGMENHRVLKVVGAAAPR